MSSVISHTQNLLPIPNLQNLPSSAKQQPSPNGNSPIVESPMDYHRISLVYRMKKKDKKKLNKKDKHTLMTDEARKSVAPIKQRFKEIHKKMRKVAVEHKEASPIVLTKGKIEITQDEKIKVTQDGTIRIFGVHNVTLANGTLRHRLFPVDGEGITPFTGSEVKQILDEYETRIDKSLPFEGFVQKAIKQQVATPANKAPNPAP